MIKIICALAVFSFFFSCDKDETRYLYNKYDPEYDVMITAAAQECITESFFFSTFDVYAEFDSAIFKENKIYKIVQDDNPFVTTYVKVNMVNANDVSLIFSSTVNDYDKILTFEESDHVSIGTFLKAAICNKNYSSYFTSVSGLGSITNMSFKWSKETITIADDDDADDVPEVYSRRADEFNVNLNYPSFFYFYNGTKTYTYIPTEGEAEKSSISKITITEVTNDEECDNDGTSDANECTTAYFNAVTRNCSLSVDDDAYKLRPHSTSALSVTGDAGCTLLKSTGGI